MPAHKKASSPKAKTASQPRPRGRFVMTKEEQTAYMIEHLDRLAKDPELAVAALQHAGILDKEGNLTEHYREGAPA